MTNSNENNGNNERIEISTFKTLLDLNQKFVESISSLDTKIQLISRDVPNRTEINEVRNVLGELKQQVMDFHNEMSRKIAKPCDFSSIESNIKECTDFVRGLKSNQQNIADKEAVGVFGSDIKLLIKHVCRIDSWFKRFGFLLGLIMSLLGISGFILSAVSFFK